IQAAGDLADDGRRIQCYVFIDEFQRIAARNIAQILQDARSYGLSLILAHQNSYDLKLRDVDLRPTVLGNTRLKLFFSSMTPDEIEWLEAVSGERLETIESSSQMHSVQSAPVSENTSESRGTTQTWRPWLTRNQIIEASNQLHRAIVHVA